MYSKEEIEEKRRKALQKQMQKNAPGDSQLKQQNPVGLNPKTFYQNQNNAKTSTPNYQKSFSNPYGARNHQNVMKNHSPSKRFNPMNRGGNKDYFDPKDEKIEVNCQLISKHKFSIEPSKFSTELNDLCKTIPSRAYGNNFFVLCKVDYNLKQLDLFFRLEYKTMVFQS